MAQNNVNTKYCSKLMHICNMQFTKAFESKNNIIKWKLRNIRDL